MTAKSKNAPKSNKSMLGFNSEGFLSAGKQQKSFQFKSDGKTGYIFLRGTKKSGLVAKELNSHLNTWQKDKFNEAQKETLSLQTELGEFLVVNLPLSSKKGQHQGLLDKSVYSLSRDLCGGALSKFIYEAQWQQIVLILDDVDKDEIQLGAMVGLELAAYHYKRSGKDLKLTITGTNKTLLDEASRIGVATNIGRHLVNTPAGELNPKSYSEFMESIVRGHKHTKVEVMTCAQLKKEKMGLLMGVGQAAEETSRLVHISYRPTKKKLDQPIAFVGKGVTFDTGGLDLKPAAGMRLMKKDMGGSASIAGLAWYVTASKLDVPCDFYLALAENAINEKAMRPGDVLTASNGKTVEIHNTDAEGRLVMADALHYATSRSGKNKPAVVIDASTLTGAMRVALGIGISGMCSNDDKMSNLMMKSGQEMGDLCWRMPLFDDYKSLLNSSFADLSNCASGGLGGGITAALFLKEFINDTKWLHLDFMGWIDRPTGALRDVGGNGQMIQAMAAFLKNAKKSDFK